MSRGALRTVVHAGGVVAVAVAALATPPPANAAVACDRSGNALLVTMSQSGDFVSLSVSSNAGNPIIVAGFGGAVTCSGATSTVTNTGAISVSDAPGVTSSSVAINEPADFAPGAAAQDGSDSSGGTPEIEFFVNLNSTRGVLSVRDRAGNVRWGSFGINPNAAPGELQPDADIFPTDVTVFEGRAGNTVNSDPVIFGAEGGAGTGVALAQSVDFVGNGGGDLLTGGDGGDMLFGFGGPDALVGGAGNDELQPGLGNDFVDGGSGTDTVDYDEGAFTSVSVDLAIAGPQGTSGAGNDSIGAVENVRATTGIDIVRGDDGPNVIATIAGSDVVEGRGGIDTIETWIGNDSIDVRDGGPDTVDCGPDEDTVVADAQGVDTLVNCETASYPAATGPGTGTGDTGGTGGTGGGTTATFGTDTLVTLRLARRRIPARGPVRVRVLNANGFAITGTVAGATARRVAVSRLRRVRLRPVPLAVGPQARTTVALRLPRTLRRILRRTGRLPLRVVAKVADPTGNTRRVTKRLTPRLRAARPG
jgi:Ca2+-binding RTX toxin-like protein